METNTDANDPVMRNVWDEFSKTLVRLRAVDLAKELSKEAPLTEEEKYRFVFAQGMETGINLISERIL